MKRIKSIGLKNSHLFHDLKIEFSENLNCIMGGRGTGKTTLLYFILAALEKNIESDNSECRDYLKSNLEDGEIQLEVELEDGNTYKIIKSLNDEPQPYKMFGDTYISFDKLSPYINCDIFEAGKIEKIGRDDQGKLDLIDSKIAEEVKSYKEQLRNIQIKLQQNAEDIKIHDKNITHINEQVDEFLNVETEFEEHKKEQPKDISEKEKKEFEEADTNEKIRTEEKIFLQKCQSYVLETKNYISNELSGADNFISEYIKIENRFYNKGIMDTALERVNKFLSFKKEELNKINNELITFETELDSFIRNLNYTHESQQAEFIKLKQKFESNKFYINKFNLLSNKKATKVRINKDLAEKIKRKEAVLKEREELIKQYSKIKNDLLNKRLECVKEINSQLGGDVKINILAGGIKSEYKNELKNSLVGSGLRYNELVDRVVENFSPDEFAKIINSDDIESLKSVMGIDDVRAGALINALKGKEEIYRIETIYCPDLPEFKLKVNKGENTESNYKNSEELSMGQRCTAVLPIIFAVSEKPLIIDQPEDNLDNKYISDRIHEIIQEQKKDRQLIFITHNPNIPVLSNSEKNIFLTYDQYSRIESQGNVDEVRDNIVNLLEGGEEAFRIRKQKYNIN